MPQKPGQVRGPQMKVGVGHGQIVQGLQDFRRPVFEFLDQYGHASIGRAHLRQELPPELGSLDAALVMRLEVEIRQQLLQQLVLRDRRLVDTRERELGVDVLQ